MHKPIALIRHLVTQFQQQHRAATRFPRCATSGGEALRSWWICKRGVDMLYRVKPGSRGNNTPALPCTSTSPLTFHRIQRGHTLQLRSHRALKGSKSPGPGTHRHTMSARADTHTLTVPACMETHTCHRHRLHVGIFIYANVYKQA